MGWLLGAKYSFCNTTEVFGRSARGLCDLESVRIGLWNIFIRYTETSGPHGVVITR